MNKYIVYGLMTASVKLGEYEAKNKEDAIKKAEQDKEANWMPSLCWQCAGEVELNDVYETEAEEIYSTKELEIE